MKLRFFEDAAHGWLEVPKALCEKFKIKPSQFSYENDDMYYLEEDCDASKFDEYCGAIGFKYEAIRLYEEKSIVRNYRRVKS